MSDDQKGLKFYLCQTPAGPQYVHLQADAKKIDPNFRIVFVDTSKQAIMDRLNELMRGPIRGIDSLDDEAPAPVKRPPPGAVGTFAEGNEPPESKWQGEAHLVREGRACNVCLTREEIEDWRASGAASMEVEELVLRITDPTHLNNLKEMIEEQADTISKKEKKK